MKTVRKAFRLSRFEMTQMARAYWRLSLVTAFYSVFLHWFVVNNYMKMFVKMGIPRALLRTFPALNTTIANSLVFISLITIPFIGNALLHRFLIRDRLTGTFLTLFSTGINPSVIWLSKLISSFIFSYLIFFVSLLFNILLTLLYFHIHIPVSFSLAINILVVGPIAALAILTLFSFLFWYMKYAQFISNVIPTFVTLGFWAYISGHPIQHFNASAIVSAITVSASVILVCYFFISRIRRETVINNSF